jgi:hypothetical protein
MRYKKRSRLQNDPNLKVHEPLFEQRLSYFFKLLSVAQFQEILYRRPDNTSECRVFYGLHRLETLNKASVVLLECLALGGR